MKSHGYKVKVILTLYNRAKYHPHQTSDMKKAMKMVRKECSYLMYLSSLSVFLSNG